MKQAPVRTKWHRMRELLDQDEIYLSAPNGGTAPYGPDVGLDKGQLMKLINAAEEAPRFVIDEQLLSLIREDDFQLSLRDMHRAKVARLPFPAMWVEINQLRQDGSTKQFAVLLAEGKVNTDRGSLILLEPPKWDFFAWVFGFNKDNDGDYVVVSPSILGIDLKTMGVTPEEAAMLGYADEPAGNVWLGFNGRVARYLPENEKTEKLVESTFQKDGGVAGSALLAAMVLMTTQGLAREAVEINVALNKDRVKKGRPPIPKHTYIHIGRVYKSAEGEDTEAYDPRKSPRPHWRRGHARRVRFGKGRQSFRWQYFEPRLVSFHGDAVVENVRQPDYIVTK